MSQHDPRVDAYIAKAAPFAQPILRHLRVLVHAHCPQVEETVKWGKPFFVYRGKSLCMMAAFKQHAGFGFWQGGQMTGVPAVSDANEGMGQFGKLTRLVDLLTDAKLAGLIR